MEKVITIELTHNDYTLYEKGNEMGMENILSTLKDEIKNAIDIVAKNENEEYEFTVVIQKTKTEKFLNNLPDFDGF